LPSIAAVKAGRLAVARPQMEGAVAALLEQGATWVLLACTEAPIAMVGASPGVAQACIDTTEVLARATVAHWRARSAMPQRSEAA
jgi:aspartate racemase